MPGDERDNRIEAAADGAAHDDASHERERVGLATTIPSDGAPIPATTPGEDAQARPPVPNLEGRTIGHFRVESKLGHGGMGAVFRAFDTSLERPVALKVLLFDRPEARKRFMREARAQAKVRHPNVVPIHFVGESEDIAFLAMDLVEGESLADRVRRGGALPVGEALQMVREVVKALAAGAVHHLVHRDIKPSNILVDAEGHVMLADFGLAKTLEPEELVADESNEGDARPSLPGALTRAGALVGTPAYMAPEQTHGPDVDHKADVYALGATLYELLTGQPPFTAEDARTLIHQHREEEPLRPRVLCPTLPPKVDALVLRMLEKDPARRPDYEALARAIEDAIPKTRTRADMFSRAAAILIDVLLMVIPVAIASRFAGGALDTLWWLMAFVVMGVIEWRFRGTPGKKLLSLRIARDDGAAVGLAAALARTVVKVWGPLLMGLLGALWGGGPVGNLASVLVFVVWSVGVAIGFRKDKRPLHDRIFGTEVVYDV